MPIIGCGAMGGEQRQPKAMWRPLHPKTKEELVKACRDARAEDYTNTIENLEVRAANSIFGQ